MLLGKWYLMFVAQGQKSEAVCSKAFLEVQKKKKKSLLELRITMQDIWEVVESLHIDKFAVVLCIHSWGGEVKQLFL